MTSLTPMDLMLVCLKLLSRGESSDGWIEQCDALEKRGLIWYDKSQHEYALTDEGRAFLEGKDRPTVILVSRNGDIIAVYGNSTVMRQDSYYSGQGTNSDLTSLADLVDRGDLTGSSGNHEMRVMRLRTGF